MKRIYLSLITALITIIGISAQNTYNMVIEMNNGTKINIGPNDVKNLTFSDGNLTVSGESIEDIKNEIAILKKKLDEQKNCECSKEIEALKAEIANLKTSDIDLINALEMQIKSLTSEIAALKENGGNNESSLKKLEEMSLEYSKEIEALKAEIANLKKSDIGDVFNALEAQIKSLTSEVAALKENGGDNESSLKKLEEMSLEYSKEIEALKAQIANLNTSDIMAAINALQMQIELITDEIATLKGNGGNNESQGGGNDDQGGSGSSAIDSHLVGVWHQDIGGSIVGFCFYADGTGWKGEWRKGGSEEHRPLTWIVDGTRLRTYNANDGDQLDDFTYSVSSDGKTLTLTDTESGYVEEFTKQ